MNPLPKDMTTETPLTDQKWIWGTGMDGSPIEVVSAEFARRLEMDRARLIEALKKYGKQSHYNCEDTWYGCPKSEEGCANDAYKPDECNCGADDHNAKVEALLSELERNEK
jgi:hypothetical protein